MERTNKTTLVKWKPSELLEVQRFCADRKLEFSGLVRSAMLYLVKQPAVFAGHAACYIDGSTLNKLRSAELPLNFEAPEPAEKPRRKPKRRRKGRLLV